MIRASICNLFFPPLDWSKGDLEKLRLCRNRAYYKVNTKRRQHLQASLSTYLHKEWLTHYTETRLSPKELLKVYTDHFEDKEICSPGVKRKGSGQGGGFRGFRGRRRGSGRTNLGLGRGPLLPAFSSIPTTTVQAAADDQTPPNGIQTPDLELIGAKVEDHADKQWNDGMLANLMLCNQVKIICISNGAE
jgi:hypothetical protein